MLPLEPLRSASRESPLNRLGFTAFTDLLCILSHVVPIYNLSGVPYPTQTSYGQNCVHFNTFPSPSLSPTLLVSANCYRNDEKPKVEDQKFHHRTPSALRQKRRKKLIKQYLPKGDEKLGVVQQLMKNVLIL
jgi:hypothetical protein